MEDNNFNQATHRRGFLGTIAAGAAAMGIATLAAPLALSAEATNASVPMDDSDAWFNKVNGKHRIVFDATGPHEIFPFAWPRVFLMSNEKTGTPEKDSTAVVILRHGAIPYAMETSLWAKYKFGEVFKVDDPVTKAPSVRNAFWKPGPDDFKVPGLGSVPIGINQLQDSGIMFCVCNVALTVYGAALAPGMNMDASTVYKEFVAGVLPGIQIVPSGVWAVGRAQEHKCAYCFVG